MKTIMKIQFDSVIISKSWAPGDDYLVVPIQDQQVLSNSFKSGDHVVVKIEVSKHD